MSSREYAAFPVHWFLGHGHVAVAPVGRDLLDRALESINEGAAPPDLHLLDGPTFRAEWRPVSGAETAYLEECAQRVVRTLLVLPVRDARRLLRMSAQEGAKALAPENFVRPREWTSEDFGGVSGAAVERAS